MLHRFHGVLFPSIRPKRRWQVYLTLLFPGEREQSQIVILFGVIQSASLYVTEISIYIDIKMRLQISVTEISSSWLNYFCMIMASSIVTSHSCYQIPWCNTHTYFYSLTHNQSLLHQKSNLLEITVLLLSLNQPQLFWNSPTCRFQLSRMVIMMVVTKSWIKTHLNTRQANGKQCFTLKISISLILKMSPWLMEACFSIAGTWTWWLPMW